MSTIHAHQVNRKASVRRSRIAKKTVVYILLILLAVLVLVPFFWMLSTSLKTNTAMWAFPPQWIPKPFIWSNYVKAFQSVPLFHYFLNTMIIEFFVIIGQVLSCTMVAYGFSRFRFPGREGLFLAMLGTMLIPTQVTMIPLFLLFSKLGWVNTYLPLIVPAYFGNAFYVFLMRQYMQTIPIDLDEAAKIDGANAFTILWRILLPILRPAITIVVVFSFTDVYNDFMNPLIYLNTPSKFTLAVGLENFVSSHGTQWNYLMAASTFALVPVLILYYFAQEQMIGGIASLGVKG